MLIYSYKYDHSISEEFDLQFAAGWKSVEKYLCKYGNQFE